MTTLRAAKAAVTLVVGLSAAVPVVAVAAEVQAKPHIILVHGAFADGMGWQHVIPLLQKEGYEVTAVQNTLVGLDEDVATTKRVIDAQKGPVVVVGHSYGGAVITGAAAGSANVKALVYLAAFAPEAKEPGGAFMEKYPSPLGKAMRPDAAGFLSVDRAMFREVFAKDVDEKTTKVMAAAQKPINGKAFESAVTAAAWKSIPSWFLVTTEDNSVNPEMQRFYAKRMGAKVTEIKSSHVPFISHPKEVASMIVEAAKDKGKASATGGSGIDAR